MRYRRWAHEVEHGEGVLARRPPQAAAELLQEDREALGGAQEEDGVDLREVEPLVQHVHGEEEREPPGAQVLDQPAAVDVAGLAGEHGRGDALVREHPGHVPGVADVDAEADALDAREVGLVPRERGLDGVEPLQRQGVGAGIDLLELGADVLAAGPEVVGVQGHGIGHAEVVEGAEELLLEGLGEPDLGGEAVVEVRRYGLAVHALGRGGQPEEDARREVVEEGPVARRGAVVGLVDHDVVVEVAADLLPEAPGGEHPDGAEEVVRSGRLVGADQELAEVRRAQHVAEGAQGLGEDLLPVRDVEEPGLPAAGGEEPFEVEGGHHRLAGARGGDDQVAPAPVRGSLGGEGFQDALLEGVRGQIEEGRGCGVGAAALARDGLAEALRGGRVEVLELLAVPVGVELGAEPLEDVRQVAGRDLEVPLEPARHGHAGHVRGPDVRRGEPRVAAQVVGLGVQARALGVVGDPDAHVGQAREPLHGRRIRGAQVRGGDDPDRDRAVAELLEGGHQQAQAGPLDERDQEVDLIRGGHLGRELARQRRVAGRAGEERGLGERRLGPQVARGQGVRRGDLHEQGPGGRDQGQIREVLVAAEPRDERDHLVGEGEPGFGLTLLAERLLEDARHEGGVPGGRLLGIELAEHATELGVPAQDLREALVVQLLVDAWGREVGHAAPFVGGARLGPGSTR
jgi:hypothetical protein